MLNTTRITILQLPQWGAFDPRFAKRQQCAMLWRDLRGEGWDDDEDMYAALLDGHRGR